MNSGVLLILDESEEEMPKKIASSHVFDFTEDTPQKPVTKKTQSKELYEIAKPRSQTNRNYSSPLSDVEESSALMKNLDQLIVNFDLDSPEKIWKKSDFEDLESNTKNDNSSLLGNKKSSNNNKNDKAKYSSISNMSGSIFEIDEIDSPFRGSKFGKNKTKSTTTTTTTIYDLDSPVSKNKKKNTNTTSKSIFDIEDLENSPSVSKKKSTTSKNVSGSTFASNRLFNDNDNDNDDDSDEENRLTFDMMMAKPKKKTAKAKSPKAPKSLKVATTKKPKNSLLGELESLPKAKATKVTKAVNTTSKTGGSISPFNDSVSLTKTVTKKRAVESDGMELPKANEPKRLKKNSASEMLIILDNKLILVKPEIIEKLEEMNCKASFSSDVRMLKGTIECRRFPIDVDLTVQDIDFSRSKIEYLILHWSAAEFVALIHQNALNKVFNDINIRYQNQLPKRVIILVEELEQYMKRRIGTQDKVYKANVASQLNKTTVNTVANSKANSKPPDPFITQEKLDDTILDLLMERNCQVNITQNSEESVEFISKFVLKLSQQPYKKAQAFDSFCAEVSIARKSSKTPQECWVSQLEQIQSVSKTIAEHIVKEYPTVRSLLTVYSSKSLSDDDKKILLSDIKLPNGRRLGSVLSEKVFRFFTETDGTKIL